VRGKYIGGRRTMKHSLFRRNRSCSDSAYSYTFLRIATTVCLSCVLLKPCDGFICHLAAWQVHFGVQWHIVYGGSWLPKERRDSGSNPRSHAEHAIAYCCCHLANTNKRSPFVSNYFGLCSLFSYMCRHRRRSLLTVGRTYSDEFASFLLFPPAFFPIPFPFCFY